jgi:hypothetical protein
MLDGIGFINRRHFGPSVEARRVFVTMQRFWNKPTRLGADCAVQDERVSSGRGRNAENGLTPTLRSKTPDVYNIDPPDPEKMHFFRPSTT